MCSKNAPKAKRKPSLRARLVRQATLTSGLVFLGASAIVLSLVYSYLTGRLTGLLTRVAADLQAEYTGIKNGVVDAAFVNHMNEDAAEHDSSRFFVVLTTKDGKLLCATPTPEPILEALLTAAIKDEYGQIERRLVDVGKARRRAVRCSTARLTDGNVVVVGVDGTSHETVFFLVLSVLCGAFFLTTLLAGTGAFLFGTRLEKRLAAISDAASAIAAGDWSQRVPAKGEVREVERLVELFNLMCDRNEHMLHELRVLTDNIAHDLRTPLTRLALAAESAALGTAKRPLADIVTDETAAMLDLINTMLEISRTDAQIEQTPRTDLNLAALIEETIAFFEPLADEKGVRLEFAAPTGGTITYSGHRAKFQRLFANLTENAIKFTPKGGKIVWQICRATEGGITLAISDTGCGIAATDIPHVFTRFWRADSSRHFPGNGLGLALVKAIVTSYGGKITCTSSLGRGTTFTLTLP